jgi:tetratricopeptide (TPR) repeat protein
VNAVRSRGFLVASAAHLSGAGISEPTRQTLLASHELDRSASLEVVRRARARFEQALIADPTSIIARNGAAISYQIEARDPRNALTSADMERLEQLIEGTRALAPDDATALLLWAGLQTQRGRPDLAIPAIERSIGLVPSYPNGYVLLARAKLAAGHAEEVRALVDKAIERGRDDPLRVSNAYVVGAEAALMLGQDGDAALLAAQGVAEWPSNPNAHALLAVVELLAGRTDEATAEMRHADRCQPGLSIANWERQHPFQVGSYERKRRQLLDALRRAGMRDG